MSEEQHDEEHGSPPAHSWGQSQSSRGDLQRSGAPQHTTYGFVAQAEIDPVPYEPTQRGGGQWQRDYYGGGERIPTECSHIRSEDNLRQFEQTDPLAGYAPLSPLQPALLYPFDPNVLISPPLPSPSFPTSPLESSTRQYASPDPRYSVDYSFPPGPSRLDSDRTVRPEFSQHSSYETVPFLPSNYPSPLDYSNSFPRPSFDTQSSYRSRIYVDSSSEEISPLSSGSGQLPLPTISPRLNVDYPLPAFASTSTGSQSALEATERRNREYLDRNRRSAIKSRQKKKDSIKGLEATAKRLSESNRGLQRTASSLEHEVASLRDAIYHEQPRSLQTAPDRTMLLDYSQIPFLGSQHDVYSTTRTTGLSPIPSSDDETTSREYTSAASSSSGPSGTLSSAFATTAITSTPSTSTASVSTDEFTGDISQIRPIPGGTTAGFVREVPQAWGRAESRSRESGESSEESHRRR